MKDADGQRRRLLQARSRRPAPPAARRSPRSPAFTGPSCDDAPDLHNPRAGPARSGVRRAGAVGARARRRRARRRRSQGSVARSPARCVVPRLRGRTRRPRRSACWPRSQCKLGLVLDATRAKGRIVVSSQRPSAGTKRPLGDPRRGAGARAAPQALAAEDLARPAASRRRSHPRENGPVARGAEVVQHARRGSPRPAPRPARRAAAVAGRRGRVPRPAPPERRTARRAPRGRRARLGGRVDGLDRLGRRFRRRPKSRAKNPRRLAGSGAATGAGTGSTSSSAAGSDRALGLRRGRRLRRSRGGSDAIRAVSVTFVPQPEGSSSTVPRARSPSQATVVSGSRRVMRISPNAPRCPARAPTSLTSAHSSGGLLTRVLCARGSSIAAELRPRPAHSSRVTAVTRPATARPQCSTPNGRLRIRSASPMPV